VKIQPQWVVTPGKQTNKHILVYVGYLTNYVTVTEILHKCTYSNGINIFVPKTV
jgi:hypothetical protein